MSERPRSSGDELYDELKAFVFERDRDFRNRDSDITVISHPPYNRRVARLYDDDDENIYVDVFNERTLALKATYNAIDRKPVTKDTKIIFKLGLVATSQLAEAPLHLRQYLPEGQPSQYTSHTPGDFIQVQSHQYTIAHNQQADEKRIDYLGDYTLYTGDDPIYQAKFPIDKHAYQRIPVATEGRTLIIPPHINEDATSEPYEQIFYDEDFKALTKTCKVSASTITHEQKIEPTHTPQLLSLYKSSQRDDAEIVRSLLKILRSSDSIPTPENLYDRIKHINRKK